MIRIAGLVFIGLNVIAPLASHETFNAARGKYFVALRKYAAGLSDLRSAFDAERELLAAETDLDAARTEEASAFALLSRRVLAPYCSDVRPAPARQKRWAI